MARILIVEDDPQIQQLRERIAGVDEDASYYDRIKLGEAISGSFDRLREQDANATLDALERFAVATAVKEAMGENGAVQEGNFDDYPTLRISEMPQVEVTIIRSAEAPTGVGEPGVPPIGPAVANAWRALTGQRTRALPMLQSGGVV